MKKLVVRIKNTEKNWIVWIKNTEGHVFYLVKGNLWSDDKGSAGRFTPRVHSEVHTLCDSLGCPFSVVF